LDFESWFTKDVQVIKQRIVSRWLASRTAGVSTGDGKFVGFFVPLPPELAEQFPDLGEEDKSPTHFTFLIIGEVPPDKREEFLAKSEDIIRSFRGPVHAMLGGIDYFTHPAKERRVAYVSVKFNKNVADWRSRLYDMAIEMGLSPTDVSPLAYNPHVTLEYMDGLYSRYMDPVPTGSWYFNTIQVWGLPEEHEFPLGVSTANRVADRQLKKKVHELNPTQRKRTMRQNA
jgi:2'-5' RNA ligase